MRLKQCKSCINKEKCKAEGNLCRQNHQHFVPDDASRRFFSRYYVGNDQHEYHFNTRNEHVEPTHTICIDGIRYCPYCGDVAYTLETNEIKRFCCICEGAQSEVKYERELAAMKLRHEQELDALRRSWADKLAFDVRKLFEKKQEAERLKFERRESLSGYHFPPGHVTTLNGHPLRELEDVLTVF